MRQPLSYHRNGYVPDRPGSCRIVPDFTRFIDDYLQAHPEVRDSQRRGWRIWWERPASMRELELIHADSVRQPPYHYD